MPPRAKNRLNNIILYLWKIKTQIQMLKRSDPVTSHAKKAHEIRGTLSRKISGSGGYLFESGTLFFLKKKKLEKFNGY